MAQYQLALNEFNLQGKTNSKTVQNQHQIGFLPSIYNGFVV